MGIVDKKKKPAKQLTSDQKNELASQNIRQMLLRSARVQRQMLKNIKRIIKNAPGSKSTIFAKFGDDATEAAEMINSMKDFVNAHKGSKDENISI